MRATKRGSIQSALTAAFPLMYLYVLPGVHISQLNRQTYVFFLLHEWANAVQSAEEVTIETSLC